MRTQFSLRLNLVRFIASVLVMISRSKLRCLSTECSRPEGLDEGAVNYEEYSVQGRLT